MSKNKLYDISWQVSEEEYREDKALSYSTISKFAREGFNKLDSLFDKVESPSLTFGSAVDSLITGGQEEFDNRFIVAQYEVPTDSILKIVNILFDEFGMTHRTLQSIPDEEIIGRTELLKYQLNWKPETRVKVIKEQGSAYYSLKYAANGRTIIDVNLKEQIDASVEALKTSEVTKLYFEPNNVFNERYVREYQLKFKSTFNNVQYRCMVDLLFVDHERKIVYPIDLKTSSKPEWDFYKSFIEWRYDIQARLYWNIIRDNMNRSPFWKEYELADYKFIVVNRKTLVPLVWEFKDTTDMTTLYYGTKTKIELQHPFVIGEQLHHYLSSLPIVPDGIEQNNNNDLTKWLNTL